MNRAYDVVILGLSITSSWGNGHATTWRSLVKGLAQRGQRVLFLEREQPWYSQHRDLHHFPHCDIRLYSSFEELQQQFTSALTNASAVIVGSFVPDGIRVCRLVLDKAQGVRAFYDIDTPVTVATLQEGHCNYLSADLVPGFDLYLSFTGGPILTRLQTTFGAPCAVPFYCSVDVDEYRPELRTLTIDLGYMGTYSADRQPKLRSLLLQPALALGEQHFAVVGAQYPSEVQWPGNVQHIEHLPPARHREFYNSQRFTLNLTRADMVAAGYSPSVRLFEAAACGVPIISDVWQGIEQLFVPNEEILLAQHAEDVIEFLQKLSEAARLRLAAAARERVLTAHSGVRRAMELEAYLAQVRARTQPMISNA